MLTGGASAAERGGVGPACQPEREEGKGGTQGAGHWAGSKLGRALGLCAMRGRGKLARGEWEIGPWPGSQGFLLFFLFSFSKHFPTRILIAK